MPSLSDIYFRLKGSGFFRGAKERVCLIQVLKIIEEQVVKNKPTLTFVQLPPGYGKTAIPYSLWAWALASKNTHVEHSVHVLPLRSMVEDVWNRFVAGLKILGLNQEEAVEIAGAECMFTHFSPFFLKSFVTTTIDTFTLLATKLPPYEISKIAREHTFGHYEIARGALLSSIVTFDEIHLLLEEESKERGATLTALLALTIALLRWRVPVIFMTATLPQGLRRSLEKWIKDRIHLVEVKAISYGEDRLEDKEFEDEVKSVKLNTKLCKDDYDYINSIVETSATYNRILVVANTIKRAQNLYEELHKRGLNPLLLHSKFTRGDREYKLKALNGDKWLCISTQVIEAGVDISANILHTDVAPLCALVQRAGRCCRPSHISEGDKGEVIICISSNALSGAGEVYNSKAVNCSLTALREINCGFNWHLHSDYMCLLERYYMSYLSSEFEKTINASKFVSMLNIILQPYFESSDAFKLLLRLGSLTRDEPLVAGIVCEPEMFDWQNYERLIPSFIPLEFKDLRRIIKNRGRLRVIGYKRNGQSSLSDRFNLPSYEEVLDGTVIAVHVPPELYDKERGLIV